MFVGIAPLLAKNTDKVTSSFRSNVLLNTGLWKNIRPKARCNFRSNVLLNTGLWKSYDDYLSSTLCLTCKEVKEIFGLCVAEEKADVWNVRIFISVTIFVHQRIMRISLQRSKFI